MTALSLLDSVIKRLEIDDSKEQDDIKDEDAINILIYGDSTTWGYNPENKKRHPIKHRWCNVLQTLLCNGYQISINGLNSRTINHDDINIKNTKNPLKNDMINGTKHLLPILYSNKYIHILIILLGINECNQKYYPINQWTVEDALNQIQNDMKNILNLSLNAPIWINNKSKKIVLISPPVIKHVNHEWNIGEYEMDISKGLSTKYKELCNEKKMKKYLRFVDANDYIETGSDSIHIDAENNIKLAHVIKDVIKSLGEVNKLS